MAVIAQHQSRKLKAELQYSPDGDTIVKTDKSFTGMKTDASEEAMNAFFNAIDNLTSDTLTNRYYVDAFELVSEEEEEDEEEKEA